MHEEAGRGDLEARREREEKSRKSMESRRDATKPKKKTSNCTRSTKFNGATWNERK